MKGEEVAALSAVLAGFLKCEKEGLATPSFRLLS